MTPRTFRPLRSRAFWFGVPGLVFLLWAWQDSMGHAAQAGFYGTPPWSIFLVKGEVTPIWDAEKLPDWRAFEVDRFGISPEWAADWRRGMAEWRQLAPSVRYIHIPYYWPIIAYVAAWAALLFWRARKFRQPSPAVEEA